VTLLTHYTIQDVSGNTRTPAWPSTSWQNSDLSATDDDRQLPHDLRHRFVGILNVSHARTTGGSRFTAFGRWTAAFVFTAESGLPFTPTQTHNELVVVSVPSIPTGEFNSESMPAYYRFDLKLGTDIQWPQRTLTLYLWALNLFDRKNAIDVYSSTGEPDYTGWLETDEGQRFVQDQKYKLRENDFANFDVSRQIRFGARLMF
jgi:hypothetical protein